MPQISWDGRYKIKCILTSLTEIIGGGKVTIFLLHFLQYWCRRDSRSSPDCMKIWSSLSFLLFSRLKWKVPRCPSLLHLALPNQAFRGENCSWLLKPRIPGFQLPWYVIHMDNWSVMGCPKSLSKLSFHLIEIVFHPRKLQVVIQYTSVTDWSCEFKCFSLGASFIHITDQSSAKRCPKSLGEQSLQYFSGDISFDWTEYNYEKNCLPHKNSNLLSENYQFWAITPPPTNHLGLSQCYRYW